MADREYRPVAHDHDEFLARAMKRKGFAEAFAEHRGKYALTRELLAARARSGLTQEEVAESMGTTKSAVSRLEGPSRHSPSLGTLSNYARAVGCTVEIRLVPAADASASPEMPAVENEVEARLRKFFAEAPEDPPSGEVDWGPPVGREVW